MQQLVTLNALEVVSIVNMWMNLISKLASMRILVWTGIYCGGKLLKREEICLIGEIRYLMFMEWNASVLGLIIEKIS